MCLRPDRPDVCAPWAEVLDAFIKEQCVSSPARGSYKIQEENSLKVGSAALLTGRKESLFERIVEPKVRHGKSSAA